MSLFLNRCSSLRIDSLPEVRVITRYQGLNVYDRDYNDLVDRMNKYQKANDYHRSDESYLPV